MWSNNNVVLVLATLALCLVALAPKPVEGLSCLRCPTDLAEKQARCGPCPRDCKFGIVLDLCGCCRRCGLGPGENCFWQFGVDQCGDGLQCKAVVVDGVTTPEGRCVPKTPS